MRSYEGQLSDNRPIRRSREQKQRQLAELEQQRASLKHHSAPALREAMDKRIQDLKQELSRPQGSGRHRSSHSHQSSAKAAFRPSRRRQQGSREP